MKKQIKVCLLIVCAIMTLTGLTTMVACKKPGGTSGVCVHAWQNATCLTPDICTKCGKTRGESLGHDFVGDTCLRCGEKKGNPLAPTEGLEYELNEDGKSYALMGLGSTEDETIIIPESHKGLPVTVIGENVFNFAAKYFDVAIKTIIMPDSVVLIKERAFSLCLDLEYLKLPDSELVLEDMAIIGLVKLKSVFIPERVKKIGKGNFVACGLENITIDANNANYYVKNNCIIEKSTKKLLAAGKNATIPDDGSVTTIESYAFSIDPSLKKLVIPNGVTKINNSAFMECMNLYSVVFADTIETVEDEAFSECENLLSITFGKNLKSIHKEAFHNCDKILEVINNSSLKVVSAYSGAPEDIKPEDIIIDANIVKTGGTSGVINIDDYLFFEYENVMYLVTYVGGESELYLPESCNGKTYSVIGQFYSRYADYTMMKVFGIEGITKIVISDGVTSIEGQAFADSLSLVSIVIGKNVTSIGDGAFRYCDKLVEVINYSSLNITKGSEDYGYVGYNALNVKTSGTTDIVNKNGYLFYTYNNVNYLLGYSGTDTDLVLPDSYNGQSYQIYKYAFSGCGELTSVVIPDSVTSIGDGAFYYCGGLTSVVIPDNVTSIGQYAFYYCSGLTSVVIPDSVTSIGGGAFEYCSGLTSVVIGNSVTSIGRYAFYDCSGLTSVVIGNSVTSIGDGAFRDCNKLVEVINYSSLNITKGSEDYGYVGYNALNVKTSGTTDIVNKNGYLFLTVDNVNYLFNYIGTDTNLVLPDSYNGQSYQIYKYAFYYCSGLTSVVIPDSVTSIGDGAFSHCRGLTSVVIPDSVTSIGGGAFEYCSGLTSVVIGNSVKSIGNYAFSGCSGLTSVVIPNSVTSIGERAFYGCRKLVEVINYSDLAIEQGSSDYGEVAYYALNVKQSGTSDIVNKNGYLFLTVDNVNYLFNYIGTDTNLVLPDSYNGQSYQIYKYAFYYCSGLTSVVIPDSVTSIGDGAFYYCSGLTSVVIPDSVTSIGGGAFEYCSGLTSVVIGNSVKSIGNYAFSGCSGLTSVVIPNSVTSIGERAFYGCRKLVEVINYSDLAIEQGSSDYGEVAYYALNVKQSGTSDIVNKNGYLFLTDSNKNNYLIGYIGKQTNLVLPDSYNRQSYQIYKYAFSDCRGLTSVVIGNSVTSIGERAFEYCYNLTNVTIPSSVTTIGKGAFYSCDSLTSVVFKNTKNWVLESEQIDSALLADAKKAAQMLTGWKNSDKTWSVYIPPTIDDGATQGLFYTLNDDGESYTCSGYGGATDVIVTISSTCNGLPVTSIGDAAFESCRGLTSVVIPDSVTSIGSYAFLGCYKLVEVINYSSLNITKGSTDYGYIGYNALNVKTSGTTDIVNKNGYLFYTYNNDNFLLGYIGTDTNLVLPDSYNGQSYQIYKYAFVNCFGLTSVVIPDSVTSIGGGAFEYCSGLTSVVIPDSVTSIGQYAFSGCSSLQYNEYDNAYYLGNKNNPYLVLVKAKDSSIASCNINSNTKLIGDAAFESCRGLTSVVIPNSVTSIGRYAFYGCYKLVEVINYSSLNITKGSSNYGYVGENALNVKTSGTTDIVNKNGYLFYTYNNVNYLLGYIGTDTNLVLPDSYNGQNYQIYKYAFYDCRGLTSVVIPDSVTSIGQYAFSGCSSLQYNEYDNAYYLGNKNNPYLVLVKAKDSSIASCNINSNTKLIGDAAFESCRGLTSVVIPDSVTSIGYGAFRDCYGLTSVVIPNSVTSIGDYAFRYCDKLVEVINYSSLNITKGSEDYGYVGYNALNVKTSGTTDIVNKNGYLFLTVDNVNYLFNYIGTDTNLVLPDSYNGQSYQIYKYAFSDCRGLTSVVIGNSVTSIGERAFEYCYNLTNVTIPESVTHIAQDAFRDDNNLTITFAYENEYTWFVVYYGIIIESDLIIDDLAGWLFSSYNSGYVLIRHTTHDLSQATCESPAVCSFCGYVSESALGHDFADEYTIDVAATCTKVGEKSRHCSRCDKKADVTTIPMVEHAYNEGTIITPAGEYTDGKKRLTCTDCGATKVVAIPALGHTHSYGDYVYSIDKHYKECVCGDKIQVENHFYTVSTTVYATCTKEGTQKYKCSTCGYFYNKSINKIAHTEVTDETVAATCTKVGKTQGSHCSVCGKIIKAQTDIPAKGHTASDFYIDKQATCTQEGSKHKECTVCKTVLTTASIPVIAHDYSTNYVKIKHENGHEGIAVYVCANCKFEDERKIAHVFDSAPIVIVPTCTTEGYTSKKCACGALSDEKYEIVPALGHDEVTNDCYLFETGATLCEQKYQTITTCKRENCKYYVEGAINEAKGHTYAVWTVAKAPTATQEGTITRKCSVCGLSTGAKFVETMPSFDSAEGKKLIVATTYNTNCLQSRNGQYTYKAQDGTEFKYDVTIPAATAHKLANGEEISLTKIYELGAKAEKGDKTYGELGFDWAGNDTATCAMTGGQGLVVCKDCGKMIVVTVKNSHQLPTEEDFANCGITCTKGGSCTYCCRMCEEEVTAEFQALGHNYSVELNPFVNSNGTYTANCKATCIRCDYIKEMANATVSIERQEATCQAPGFIKYTCVDKNGETLTVTETIAQLKHYANVTLVAGGTEEVEIDTTKVYNLNKYVIEVTGNSNVTCADGEAKGLIACTTCSKFFIVKVIAKHTAPAGYTYKTPTCQVQYDDFTCTVCGQAAHEAVEVLEHKYTYELRDIDTVAKTATLVKTCTVGAEGTTEDVTNLTSKTVRAATCTVKEIIRYTYTVAGTQVSIDVEGNYAPHHFADGEAMVNPGNGKVYTVGDHGIEASGNTPAVCSSTGLGLAECKDCTRTIIVYIKGPHTVNESTVDKKEPTCTEDGYYHYNCLNCGELVKDEVENPSKYKAIGHKYYYTVKTEPTTNAKGELVGKCKTCDDETSVELPKLNSTDYTVNAATCSVKATYTWKNKDYGTFTFEDKDGAVATHTKTKVVGEYPVESTNEKGEQIKTDYVIYYCEKCGNNIREIVKVTVVG